jgi:hypothetical protein
MTIILSQAVSLRGIPAGDGDFFPRRGSLPHQLGARLTAALAPEEGGCVRPTSADWCLPRARVRYLLKNR